MKIHEYTRALKHAYISITTDSGQEMLSVREHPQTIRVKQAILSTVNIDERGHVRIGEPERRQLEGKLVVENFNALCVSDLQRKLPVGSRVFCRAASRGGSQVVLSRIEVYYPLDDRVWRARHGVLLCVWVVVPLVAFFITHV